MSISKQLIIPREDGIPITTFFQRDGAWLQLKPIFGEIVNLHSELPVDMEEGNGMEIVAGIYNFGFPVREIQNLKVGFSSQPIYNDFLVPSNHYAGNTHNFYYCYSCLGSQELKFCIRAFEVHFGFDEMTLVN